jgi:hypothetical protein
MTSFVPRQTVLTWFEFVLIVLTSQKYIYVLKLQNFLSIKCTKDRRNAHFGSLCRNIAIVSPFCLQIFFKFIMV